MISRREFIRGSLATVATGLAVPGIFSQAVVAAAEAASTRSVSGKTLVVVQLAGGLDGLSAVIPYQDPVYQRSRQALGDNPESLLHLNDRVAFPPAFTLMKQLFDAGHLAVIEGVGYENPSFSHFKATDIWQFADPTGVGSDGWLGRYFEGLTDADGHPLQGLSYGSRLPEAFQSSKVSIPAVSSIDAFQLQDATGDPSSGDRRSSLLRLYDVYKPVNARFGALLDTTLDNALESSRVLTEARAAYRPAVAYPQTPLATGLQLLAQLIDSGGEPGANPLRVGHVSLGGFDTHTNQNQTLSRLLLETSEAIHAFWSDITAHGHGDDVLVMSWSEFGRRVQPNGQDGTDHGSAVPMFIVGNAVRGGLYGEPSPLDNLDNGNLRYTTDFRSVYATILERWLNAPADDLLHGRFPQLQFLKS